MKCEECQGRVIKNRNEYVCEQCGLVDSIEILNSISTDSEISNLNYVDKNLPSVVHTDGTSETERIKKLTTYHLHDNKEKCLKKHILKIRKYCCILGLSDLIKADVITMFRKIKEDDELTRNNPLYYACIVLTCRKHKTVINESTLLDTIGVKQSNAFKCLRKINKIFNVPPMTEYEYLVFLARHFSLSNDEYQKALIMIPQLDNKLIPKIKAAKAVYEITENIYQRELCEVLDISERVFHPKY